MTTAKRYTTTASTHPDATPGSVVTFEPSPAPCNASTSDGNADDPTYAYCDLTPGHAGDHNYVA